MATDIKLPKLKGVTGHALEVKGVLPIKFTFGNFSISHPVIIYEGGEKICLLGNDVILDKINYEKGRFLSFGHGHEKVPVLYNLPSVIGKLKSTHVIPPKTTQICTIHIVEASENTGLEGREIVVSRNEDCRIEQGVVLENSMSIIGSGSTAKVMIVNNTPEMITLYKGAPVANVDFVSPTNDMDSGLQVTATQAEYEQFVQMIHEADERKELLDGVGEMFPQPHGIEAKEADERPWIDKVKRDHLNDEQWGKLKEVLIKRADAFAKSDNEMGLCNYFKASLPVKENAGFLYLKPRPLPHAHQIEADKVVTNLLKLGIIRQSKSPHATNIVCVKRKAIDGVVKTRVCVDLRLQNSHAIPHRFPNMQLDEAMTKIGQATYRTSLDFKNGFHQIALDDKSIPYTAFHCNGVLYEYVRVPFGHVSAMGLWCNVMALLCKGYDPSVWYADDCMICTIKKLAESLPQAFDKHLKDLDGMFARIIEAGLKLNPEKCEFAHHCSKPMDWLGFTMEKSLLKPQESKVETVKNFELPKTRKQAESFVSLASFYRRFIKSFAKIAKPIYEAIHEEPFKWTDDANKAFEALKNALCSYPVLNLPKVNEPFQIWTDASGHAIGAVLTQISEEDGKMHPVAYASRKFNKTELKFSTPCKELLAIIYALTTWNMYICGMPCTVYSDCRCWTFMKMKEGISSRVSRLALLVLEYDLDIKYVPGSKNLAADGLSRQHDTENVKLESPNSLSDPNLELLSAPKLGQDQSMKLTEYLQLCEEYVQQFERKIATINQQKVKQEVNLIEQVLSVTPLLHIDKQMTGACQNDQPFNYTGYSSTIEEANNSVDRIALITLKEHFFSPEGFLEMQKTDKKLFRIINNLERADKNTKTPDGFILRKGLLMREIKHEDSRKIYVLCVPTMLRQQILAHYHGSLVRGHVGARRLYLHLKSIFYWDTMKADVQKFNDECINCAYNSKYPVKFNHGTVITPKYPNHIVHADLMVGLPRSRDGYHALLLCYDGFSRFSYGIPLRSEKSDYIIKQFYQFYVAAFGLPWALHTDVALNLENTVIHMLARILGIKKAITPIYNPKSNSCETLCGVMGDLLRKHTSKQDQKYWSLLVPMLLQSINNTVHTQTGYTPASLMLGRFKENDAIPLVPVEDLSEDLDEYVSSLRRFQEYAYQLTRHKHKVAAEKRKEILNKNSRPHPYVEGDFVMVKELQPAKKGDLKLRNKYRGPFRVIKAFEASLIVIPWTINEEYEQMRLTRKRMQPMQPVVTDIVPVSICKPYKREVKKPIDFDEQFMQKLIELLGGQVDLDLESVISHESESLDGAQPQQQLDDDDDSLPPQHPQVPPPPPGDEGDDDDQDNGNNDNNDMQHETESDITPEQQGYQTPPGSAPGDGVSTDSSNELDEEEQEQDEQLAAMPAYEGLNEWLANLDYRVRAENQARMALGQGEDEQDLIDLDPVPVAQQRQELPPAQPPPPPLPAAPSAATGAIPKEPPKGPQKRQKPDSPPESTDKSAATAAESPEVRRALVFDSPGAARVPSPPARRQTTWYEQALHDEALTEEERAMLQGMRGGLGRSPPSGASTSRPATASAAPTRSSPRIAGKPRPDYTKKAGPHSMITRSKQASDKPKVTLGQEAEQISDLPKPSASSQVPPSTLKVQMPKELSKIVDKTTTKSIKSAKQSLFGSKIARTPP